MAMELATGYVSLAVETSGLGKQIGKQFSMAEGLASSSGTKMGQSIKKGIDSAKPVDLEPLQDKIVEGQKKVDASIEQGARKVEAANAKVQVAEAKLSEARSKQQQSVGKVKSAEENLENVRVSAAGRVSAAEAKLDEVRSSGTATQSQILKAENAVTDARMQGNTRIRSAEEGLNKARAASTNNSGVITAERNLSAARENVTTVSMKAEAATRGYTEDLDRAKTKLAEAEQSNKDLANSTEKAGGAFSRMGQAFTSALKGDFSGAFSSIKGDSAVAADTVEHEFSDASSQGASAIESGFSAVLGKLPALVGAAGIGVAFTDAISKGFENERLTDRLSAQLNLTAPQSAIAGTVAGKLYASAYGDSMAETTDAVSSVMSSIKGMSTASQGDLERITGYALNLSDAFGVDVNEAVGSVGVMLNNGLASDADEAFDLITGSMQKMPAGFRDELFPAITEYGKHFQGLGIDGESAMNMLVRGSENGTIGIDKMGDAVKEFQIRSTDMSDATRDAYGMIGLDADDMTAKLLAGGDSAEDAFGQIIHGLQQMDDPSAQSQAALAFFGTQLEDLSVSEIPGFLGVLDPAGDQLDSLKGSAENMGNSLRDNAATNIEGFKRSLAQGWTKAVSGVVGAFDGLLGALEPVWNFLVETKDIWGPFALGVGLVAAAFGIYTGVMWAATAASGAFAGVWAFITSPITIAIAVIGLLVGAVIWLWNNVSWFRDGVTVALQTVGGWFTWLWQNAVVPAWQGIVVAAQWAWQTILQPIFSAIWGFITNVLAPAFVWFWQSVIVPAWNGIVTAISWAWVTIIQPLFQAIWSFVTNILAPVFVWLWQTILVPVWNGIVAVVSWAWNAIIKPLFAAIQWFVANILGPVFTWLYQNIIKPVWNLISWAIGVAWVIVKNIFQAIWAFITNVLGPVFTWLWANIVQPLFSAIGSFIKWTWENVIRPAWEGLKWFIDNVLAPVFTWLYESIIRPVWDWISDKISRTVNWIRDSILSPLGDWIQNNFVDAWEKTKDGISTAWDKLKEAVKAPIKFVVDTVINKGFIDGFNNLNDFWHGDDIKHLELGFARGGVLPGYQSAKRDDVMTPMRSGEGVLVPEAVRGLGAGFVHAANAAGNSGGVQGVKKWAQSSLTPGYAEGGVVSPLKGNYGVTQGYNRVHKGIDLGAPSGTPIYATSDGTISHAGAGARAPGVWGGNEIHLRGGGLERWYAHLSEIAVRVGQQVKRGQYLGKSGNTGISSGPHLHFGVFRGGWPNDINPFDYLQGAIQPTGDDGSGGGGGGNWLVDMIRDMVKDKVDNKVSEAKKAFGGNGFVDMPIDVGHRAIDAVIDWTAEKFGGSSDTSVAGSESVAVSKPAAAWRDTVIEALKRTGLPTSSAYVDAWIRQIQTESGGNPNAVQGNIGDINNQTGDIAKGLVQVIGTTFAAYRDKSLPNNRFDPLASLVAGMNWAKAAYGVGGMLRQVGHGVGYAEGGIVGGAPAFAGQFAPIMSGKFGAAPALFDHGGVIQGGSGLQFIDHQRSTPDYVLTDRQWDAMYTIADNSTHAAPQVNVTVPEREGLDPAQFGRRVGETTAFALERALR